VLGDQAGLAVDRALQERQAGFPAGDADVEAGDLPGAFDRAQRGRDESAAVGGHGGAGSRMPMRAPMSWASQACLNSLTMLA
jgi:hypothetical protein